MIKYGCQQISEADIMALTDVLRSEYLTQGPAVQTFEGELNKHCKSKFAVAVNSATSALHIAYLALELGPGDYLWTSPNTFVSTANAALMCGAKLDFVDIDPKTYNMCAENLEAKLKKAAEAGKLPKIVVPVHFAGTPCDMKRIKSLSEKYFFKIVEDASHAIGATYSADNNFASDNPVGSGTYSDLTVFSFHPVKIITTGEGGAVLCNDAKLDNTLRLLRSHGVSRNPEDLTASNTGAWCFEQTMLGYNYRMTDIQAALGTSQIRSLDQFIRRRLEICQRYNQHLSDFKYISLPVVPSSGNSSHHLYVIQLNNSLRSHRGQIFNDLTDLGVGVNVHYRPVPQQAYYQNIDLVYDDFSVSKDYYERAITLPLHAGLSDDDVLFVSQSVKKIISKYD